MVVAYQTLNVCLLDQVRLLLSLLWKDEYLVSEIKSKLSFFDDDDSD